MSAVLFNLLIRKLGSGTRCVSVKLADSTYLGRIANEKESVMLQEELNELVELGRRVGCSDQTVKVVYCGSRDANFSSALNFCQRLPPADPTINGCLVIQAGNHRWLDVILDISLPCVLLYTNLMAH